MKRAYGKNSGNSSYANDSGNEHFDRRIIDRDWFNTRWVDKYNFERDWSRKKWTHRQKFGN